MRRLTTFLIFLAGLALLQITPATAAWFFGDDTLVTLDGENYSVDDFKRWWNFYNDEGRPLPQTPDKYIEWILLTREGARMQLDSTPVFQNQTRIFLLTRGLLMLRTEEVINRIKVTDEDIRARYEKEYLPRWTVKHLTFKDETAAAAALQELEAGKLTVQELSARKPENGGPVDTGTSRLRPKQVDPEWASRFSDMAVGDVILPGNDDKKGKELYHLVGEEGADEEDFAKFREGIGKELWREQENAFTQKLLADLRDTYQVQVDEERLASLDILAPTDTFTDAPIITTSKENFSEKQVMTVINRVRANRSMFAHVEGNQELIDAIKDEAVNNMIAQYTTNWAALDRHYEEKEPMKWEYDFNYKYRLMTALESRLFAPEATVSEEEVKQYYQENIHLYTQPTLVKLYIIEETQGPIDQIWAEAAVGTSDTSFKQLLNKHFELDLKPIETPANHLDPQVKAVVDMLSEGGTSQIFKAQGTRVMVHLVARIPESPIPLENIGETIRKTVWKEKVNRMVNEYVDKLKSASEIKLQEKQWKKIRKELGEV